MRRRRPPSLASEPCRPRPEEGRLPDIVEGVGGCAAATSAWRRRPARRLPSWIVEQSVAGDDSPGAAGGKPGQPGPMGVGLCGLRMGSRVRRGAIFIP